MNLLFHPGTCAIINGYYVAAIAILQIKSTAIFGDGTIYIRDRGVIERLRSQVINIGGIHKNINSIRIPNIGKVQDAYSIWRWVAEYGAPVAGILITTVRTTPGSRPTVGSQVQEPYPVNDRIAVMSLVVCIAGAITAAIYVRRAAMDTAYIFTRVVAGMEDQRKKCQT